MSLGHHFGKLRYVQCLRILEDLKAKAFCSLGPHMSGLIDSEEALVRRAQMRIPKEGPG